MDKENALFEMPDEMSDIFRNEIIKCLNDITLGGKRKILKVGKYGNSIFVRLSGHETLPPATYKFGLATKMGNVVMD